MQKFGSDLTGHLVGILNRGASSCRVILSGGRAPCPDCRIVDTIPELEVSQHSPTQGFKRGHPQARVERDLSAYSLALDCQGELA